MDDFKPNSHRFKEQQANKNAVAETNNNKPAPAKKVVKTAVKVKKKNFFTELFLPEDISNARDYIVHDIVVPLIKKGINDTVESLLYPDGRGRRSNGNSRNNTRVSYSSYYETDRPYYQRDSDRDREIHRSSRSFENVIFTTKGEAFDVLNEMEIRIGEYGSISVRDFYELVDLPGRYTDVKYGWTDLRNVSVRRDGHGYSLTLPTPKVLD